MLPIQGAHFWGANASNNNLVNGLWTLVTRINSSHNYGIVVLMMKQTNVLVAQSCLAWSGVHGQVLIELPAAPPQKHLKGAVMIRLDYLESVRISSLQRGPETCWI